jgi:hypothetical protein
MTLLGMQTVLAQLYTDRVFRAAFFVDPVATCARSALTEVECHQLATLDRLQVERYAWSLQGKRLHLVRALLPATANTLAEQFAPLFHKYCDTQPSAPEHVDEAIAFITFLSVAGITEPAYLDDLLTCERLRLEVLYALADANPRGLEITPEAYPQLTAHARVAAFQYDMATLYPLIANGVRVEARPDPSLVLIGKVRDQLRVKWKRINATTAQLLGLCNGTRTVQAMIDEVATGVLLHAEAMHTFTTECVMLLQSLVDSSLMTLCADTSEFWWP